MDVKNVIRSLIPTGASGLSESQRKNFREGLNEKTELSHDRDANGQSPQGEEQGRRGLSDQELNEAVEILRQMPGVAENGLEIELSRSEDGVPFVVVRDRSGQVVRRIPEIELSLLKKSQAEKKTGRLLNRTG